MRHLGKNPYMSVELFVDRPVVKVIRSDLAFETPEQIVSSFDDVCRMLATLQRGRFCQLQDLRAARGRNDPLFEKLIARERKRVATGFRKVAVLVRTPVGKMQIERYLKEDGLDGRAFFEDEDALSWLEH
jgi:hypothetical protein